LKSILKFLLILFPLCSFAQLEHLSYDDFHKHSYRQLIRLYQDHPGERKTIRNFRNKNRLGYCLYIFTLPSLGVSVAAGLALNGTFTKRRLYHVLNDMVFAAADGSRIRDSKLVNRDDFARLSYLQILANFGRDEQKAGEIDRARHANAMKVGCTIAAVYSGLFVLSGFGLMTFGLFSKGEPAVISLALGLPMFAAGGLLLHVSNKKLDQAKFISNKGKLYDRLNGITY
jgi:hypothetical protein